MHLEPLMSVTASMRPVDLGGTPAGRRLNLHAPSVWAQRESTMPRGPSS
jgi:hypothetical protein